MKDSHGVFMKKPRMLVKLGGSALQDPKTLKELVLLLQKSRSTHDVVLVHGGGPAINQALTEKGITWQFINGQRQTTPEMMGVIEEVLAHQINSKLVQTLNSVDIAAAGVSGAEENTLFCSKASGELMQVGKIESVNADMIESCLEQGLLPVVAPIGIGAQNEKYNINADWAAAKIAVALKAEKLLFLTDQNGVLDGEKNIIPVLTPGLIQDLIETGVVSGGMLTKVNTMLSALQEGVSQVRVVNANQASNSSGTVLVQTISTKEGRVWNQNSI